MHSIKIGCRFVVQLVVFNFNLLYIPQSDIHVSTLTTQAIYLYDVDSGPDLLI